MRKIAHNNAKIWWQVLEMLAHIALIGLVLWTPAGNVFGKSVRAFFFAGSVGLMLIVYAVLWWKDSVYRSSIRISWVHGALLVFVLALGLSAIASTDPSRSWFGTLHFGVGTLYLYCAALWAVLVGTLVRERTGFLSRLLQNIFLCAVVVAFTTFSGKNGGVIGNSSFAGAYLLFGVGAGAALVWLYKKVWQKVLAILGVLLITLGPVFVNAHVWTGNVHSITQLVGVAQGASMGLALAVVISILVAAICSRKRIVQWVGAVGFVCVLGGLWWGSVQFINPTSTLHRYVVEQKSANRFLFWNAAAAGLLDRPVFGYGFENYATVLQTHFDPIIFAPGYEPEVSIEHAHNVFWEYAATTGSVGLVAYITLFATVFLALFFGTKQSERVVRIVSIVFCGVLGGYLLQNMFVFDTSVSYAMYFSVIGIAIGIARPAVSVATSRMRFGAIVISGIGVCIVSVLAVAPWRESVAWTRAITASNTPDQSPQKVSHVGTVADTIYLASQLYGRTQSKIGAAHADEFLKEKYSLFIKYLEEDSIRESMEYRAYLMKGVLENALVSISHHADSVILAAARADFDRALLLNPRSPEVYFNRAQTALYERDMRAATGFIRAGIALEPRYTEGYSIADALLKIVPDPDFANYLSRMRKAYHP